MASFHSQPGKSLPPHATSVPPGGSSASHDHPRRRFFIGPMPEKEASRTDVDLDNRKLTRQIKSWLRSSAGEQNEDESFSVLQNHAHHHFLRHGGRKEDWGQQAETDVRQGIWQWWQESEWGGALKRRRKDTGSTAQRWVGGSFEVGNVLGLNVLDNAPKSLPHANQNQTCSNSPIEGPSKAEPLSTVSRQSFVTASVEPSSSAMNSDTALSFSRSSTKEIFSEPSQSSSTAPLTAGIVPEDRRSIHGLNVALPEGSQRPILKGKKYPTHTTANKQRTSFIIGGRIITPRDPHTPGGKLEKGKSRSFDHPIPPQGTSSSLQLPAEVDDIPTPPAAVFARNGSDADENSAGAALEETPPRHTRDDIILRDRMLVRVSYTTSESLSRHFDEVQNRITAKLKYEDWAEFLVVWRGERLEIYEDYTFPGKEFITGHKHLAFIIPLRSERTYSSLYSFTDFTFCITCPPTPVRNGHSKARALFHRAKEGTNVFVFKAKCRTRGMDWCWHLWLRLGGKIPTSIDLRCPAIGTRVVLDVPVVDTASIEMFSRSHVIDIVRKSLNSSRGHEAASRDWKHVIEREIAAGKTLELAWRVEAKLDWIWMEEDVMGQPRPWAVLCGLAMRQGAKPANLELRLGQHYPATIHLPDGTNAHEPPCVEGYLDRIKSNKIKQHIYLTSHDGNLFALSPSNSHPPVPPNVHLSHMLSSRHDETSKNAQSLGEAEVARGAAQIAAAFEVFDLRNISEIRRAIHANIDHDTVKHAVVSESNGSMAHHDSLPRDEDDVGGAEGLVQASDKSKLRVGRSFEIVLMSGHVVRFETYSCRTSQEWVDRLRALLMYWTKRQRVDARDEMEISYCTRHRPRITPPVKKHAFGHGYETPTTAVMDAEFLPELSALYHWCMLDNCRSILKSGRAFARKGLQGQYKLVQLFLVAGRLLQYNVSRNSFQHHRRREINLIDSYVCSGYLAALALRSSEYDPQAPSLARRYFDGLEVDDPEEDLLFTIWYRKIRDGAADKLPSLSAKHNFVVFRTRSRIERDAWCWALGCEIEKLVRINKDRETKLRDAGGLVEMSEFGE